MHISPAVAVHSTKFCISFFSFVVSLYSLLILLSSRTFSCLTSLYRWFWSALTEHPIFWCLWSNEQLNRMQCLILSFLNRFFPFWYIQFTMEKLFQNGSCVRLYYNSASLNSKTSHVFCVFFVNLTSIHTWVHTVHTNQDAVFIRINAQPRKSAYPKGRVNKRPPSNMRPSQGPKIS